jgi:hypothetical protein
MTLDHEDGWHLDKKVPISIIAAMLVQLAAALWFVSKLDARVIALETALIAQHERDALQDKASNDSDTLIRMQLTRIDDKLDRLLAGAQRNKP